MSNCAIILTGCGKNDGTDIYEASLAAYFCDKHNISVTFFAPDHVQHNVINHTNNSLMQDSRNCLIEAARIAQGNIEPLNTVDYDYIDLALYPGGQGWTTSITNYAEKTIPITIHPDIKNFALTMQQQQKPQGFLAITTIIAATLFPNVITTLGINQQNLDILDKMGAQSRHALATDIIIDNTHNIYSTPASMINIGLNDIANGIEKLITTIQEAIETKNSN